MFNAYRLLRKKRDKIPLAVTRVEQKMSVVNVLQCCFDEITKDERTGPDKWSWILEQMTVCSTRYAALLWTPHYSTDEFFTSMCPDAVATSIQKIDCTLTAVHLISVIWRELIDIQIIFIDSQKICLILYRNAFQK